MTRNLSSSSHENCSSNSRKSAPKVQKIPNKLLGFSIISGILPLTTYFIDLTTFEFTDARCRLRKVQSNTEIIPSFLIICLQNLSIQIYLQTEVSEKNLPSNFCLVEIILQRIIPFHFRLSILLNCSKGYYFSSSVYKLKSD